MKKDQIAEDSPYVMGWIVQRCNKCEWNGDKLDVELQTCPSCEEPIFDDAILTFGGLTVQSDDGLRFFLRSRWSGSLVEVDRADASDTITYLVKHFKGAE